MLKTVRLTVCWNNTLSLNRVCKNSAYHVYYNGSTPCWIHHGSTPGPLSNVVPNRTPTTTHFSLHLNSFQHLGTTLNFTQTPQKTQSSILASNRTSWHPKEVIFPMIFPVVFSFYDEDQRHSNYGVFPLASLFNHSCAPNMCKVLLADWVSWQHEGEGVGRGIR